MFDQSSNPCSAGRGGEPRGPSNRPSKLTSCSRGPSTVPLPSQSIVADGKPVIRPIGGSIRVPFPSNSSGEPSQCRLAGGTPRIHPRVSGTSGAYHAVADGAGCNVSGPSTRYVSSTDCSTLLE